MRVSSSVGERNSRSSFAIASVNSQLNATIPPNAEIGSALTACLYASRTSPPQPLALATPHGLVCFTTTHVGSEDGKSLTHVYAASASR